MITDLKKLLEEDYVRRLLMQYLPKYYPEFKEILNIELRPYKKHLGRTSAVYVVGYLCTYQKQTGSQAYLNIFVSAHTDGSRQAAYLNNQFLYQHGFASGHYLVPKPLFYLPDMQAFFYEGVRGRILKKLISDEPQRDLHPVLTMAANWLTRLHNLEASAINLKVKDFFIKDMTPKTGDFLADFSQYKPSEGEIIKTALRDILGIEASLAATFNKTLVHGDFHPENIIVSGLEPNHLKVIDFTDLSWGDPCLDIGIFLQQFDFMLNNLLPRNKINDYKKFFVEAYFSENFEDIDQVFINRINLYQAWTALRTSVFLFYARSARLNELLIEIEQYLQAIRTNKLIINLYE
ncbi:MAG: aminoglycoside phosphotransferase family protein [Patescibacteria group bacterium]